MDTGDVVMLEAVVSGPSAMDVCSLCIGGSDEGETAWCCEWLFVPGVLVMTESRVLDGDILSTLECECDFLPGVLSTRP